MATPVTELTDIQLDVTLDRLYREHAKAGIQRRKVLHTLICVVLEEQRVRRDEVLGIRTLTEPLASAQPTRR